MKRHDIVDHVLAIIIVIILWVCVDAIVDTAQAQATLEEPTPWSAPAIPQCDKELWERIRNGC